MRLRNLADLHLGFAEAGAWRLSGDARLYHRYDRSQFEDPLPVLGPPLESDNRNHSAGGRGELRRELVAGSSLHRGALGLEARGDWLVSRDFEDRSRAVVGVFAQDEIRLLEGGVRAVPALRFDHTEGFGEAWIPRFGLLVRPAPWLELKGNVERAYRVPNFDELYFDEEFVRGNPNLDPEDALDADVGLELSLERLGPATGLSLELAFFRNDVRESIVFQPVSQFVVAASNTGPALSQGLELAGGLRLLAWIGLEANWTHLSSKAQRTGQPLPGRAEDEVLVRVRLGPASGLFELTGECLYTSELPVTADGGTRVSARTVWNASAALDLLQLPWLDVHLPGERLLVSLTGDNLGDVSVRDAQFFPQPGRWLTLRVEWRL
jgi:outer membrane receptor protein involved in Fe transport